MAGLAFSGVWLVVMLTDAVNGYPTKNALDLHRGYDTPPGSGWGGPPNGFSPSSNPAFYEPAYSQTSAEMRPVPAVYSTDVYPVYSEHDGSSPSSATHSGFQVTPVQENWAVPPPSPFYHGVSSPGELEFASKPEPPGYMSPPGPFLPQFQPGELSYEEKSYEHGNYNSESEEQRPPAPPLQYLPVPALSRLPISSPLALGALLDRLRFGSPYVDYMLLTRNHPPGTYTFYTNDFQHGKNQWHNNHYIGAPDRLSEQFDTFDPWSTKQPKQFVQRSVEDADYDEII